MSKRLILVQIPFHIIIKLVKKFNDDIILEIIKFFLEHPNAKLFKECHSMTFQLKHLGTRKPVFELIKSGFSIENDNIGYNPTLWYHFIASKHLRPSLDFRPKNAKGLKGRKNDPGKGKGGGKGKGEGETVSKIYSEVSQEYRRQKGMRS
jgi:hypothetical protein